MGVQEFLNFMLGWPFLIYVVGASIICTLTFKGIQFRYFWQACRAIFHPTAKPAEGDMTPVQAFINTLSTNLGNGSVAGMATAVYAGGPGAAFWVVIIGLLLMSVRFAEVYLSVLYGDKYPQTQVLGGPLLYLKDVVGGTFLVWIYGVACLFFSLIVGNAMQSNSIRVSINTLFRIGENTVWHPVPIATAFCLFIFALYVVLGGAKRVVKLSDAIVPVKVVVFFFSTTLVLIYHYASLPGALRLIFYSAFNPLALAGGVIGFSVQQAIRYGTLRSINATESGLGTAAILFSSTGSDNHVLTGLMSMISTFISTLVCFIVALCIIVSGVWSSGLNSTALTIASFDTVFGALGSWLVSFLSISFGMGVLVAYAYITRYAWLSLTKGKWPYFYMVLYCLFCFGGALVDIEVVWSLCDYLNATMLVINVFGVIYLLPKMVPGVRAYMDS